MKFLLNFIGADNLFQYNIDPPLAYPNTSTHDLERLLHILIQVPPTYKL